MKRWGKWIIIFLAFLSGIPAVFAQPDQSWSAWVQNLRQDAIAQGVKPQLFDNIFNGLQPDSSILHFDRHQPEHRISFLQYRTTRADAYRISMGQNEYRRYQNTLTDVGKQFGVDPCIITAIWGMETSYGHYLGKFSVIRSLATLAYDTRRGATFRQELLYALKILNDGHVDYKDFKGEWAGASGQPQFMPSSWLKYAVDYDHNGRKDIWTNYGDAFASIANYLAQNGWQGGEPWGVEVVLPGGFDTSLLNSKQIRTAAEWGSLGVKSKNGGPLPSANASATLIQPDGGPALMVFNNFKVIKTYNNSTFYAGTIGYLADSICRKNL